MGGDGSRAARSQGALCDGAVGLRVTAEFVVADEYGNGRVGIWLLVSGRDERWWNRRWVRAGGLWNDLVGTAASSWALVLLVGDGSGLLRRSARVSNGRSG